MHTNRREDKATESNRRLTQMHPESPLETLSSISGCIRFHLQFVLFLPILSRQFAVDFSIFGMQLRNPDLKGVLLVKNDLAFRRYKSGAGDGRDD